VNICPKFAYSVVKSIQLYSFYNFGDRGRGRDIVECILKFIDVLVFEIFDLKLQISVSVARQPALPWQPFCAPLVGGLPRVSFQV